MTRSALLIALFGCGGPSSSSTPAAAIPSPPLEVPPLDASAPAEPAEANAPRVDATCTTNEDCEAVFTGDDCCPQCRPRVANKSWKRDLDAYCAKDEHRGKCEPMGCSWGYSKPRCEKGLCK